MLETALGNYILLEVYREPELPGSKTDFEGRSHHLTPDNSAPRPSLWSAAAVTVLGGLLALLALEATPRAIAALSVHAQTTVAELGLPTRWTF
ncbi:hypothetical protein C8B47_24105 [filamentous cyanobacterium CCP4]|nr:hypothetical protein C8B47_24105 [filamentous cyanobacterium CCP4]